MTTTSYERETLTRLGLGEEPHLDGRLGIDVPSSSWPTTSTLKAFEAAGYSWVQLHSPPRSILADPTLAQRHSAAVGGLLEMSGLRVVLHAPDDLSAGSREHDRAFEGLLEYAAEVHAELVVYHLANFGLGDGLDAFGDRLREERSSLAPLVRRAEALGVTIACENLAPVYPGPVRLCHIPPFIARLVETLDSERVGMCFDVGHAHIVAGLMCTDVRSFLEPLADGIVLFHIHDNLAYGHERHEVPGTDPLRLDLHLAPGNGTIAWHEIAPVLLSHSAPLQLEVRPPHRPSPVTVATVTAELLRS